jgi:hypothetical protein
MKSDTELKHLINKSIYLMGAIVVACLCGFWIHDCHKYSPPETCHSSSFIMNNGDGEPTKCFTGAIITTQVLDPDPNPNNYRYKVLITCSCPQPTVAKP